ncbi:MAG: 3' terminal RNA ribose 2'-O-methyltransferase Hen1 [Reyranella sp.]|uniref:3' terminal RNA ribose 2'-O-methyltransferase Hen1 n=1 Tax=Reyranella sp. TaxID=1929291 RepID=UPI001AC5482A|nr:3' terminal RNA ribose 2'-O-methyltransferase Hen1 [Reyranella sp.]MBN9090958.1 3' terminal RNA ribose 2'-O-methyltransferase Hen1 [Reyranella sp.]
MYLSLATTHRPATDLGFLLHKNPVRLHETALTFGKAFLFYPEVSVERCEAALVLDVDPIELVRGKGRADGLLDQYVNDRPYAASSFLSVALGRVLGTAMAGNSRERPDLAATALPLEAAVTPVSGGEALIRGLFEPLGWNVSVDVLPADYATLRLSGTARLQALLNHLYVLIPVLDNDKHYWVGEDEVTKLLKRGEGWLETHPARETIVGRYLKHRRGLARQALERLVPETEKEADGRDERLTREDAIEIPLRLNDQRLEAVVEALRAARARKIADLGCGEGKLLQRLLRERWIESLVGVDASTLSLDRAQRRLKLDLASGPSLGRVRLLHGALTYRDKRWEEADAAALVEVIEHLDSDRLPALEQIVFGIARPKTAVVTTPNADYNVLFPNLPPGELRHPDHRFEWTRAQFHGWAEEVGRAHGYGLAFGEIGSRHEAFGAPTQMAVFSREAA